MALQSSGAISMSNINVELGYSATATISLNDGPVRALLQRSSGNVSMSDAHGKSACAAYGTFITSYCSGYSLYYRYANGSCGTYDTLIENNSTSCGYCPPSGTYDSQYCSGYNLYYRYANGSCGTYDSLVESNSTTCGYCPPSGTYLSQYCSGTTLYYRYANGSCGYYDSIYAYNSTTCGWCQTYGVQVGTECQGYNLYDVYADGNCGTYLVFITGNANQCGYTSGICSGCSGASQGLGGGDTMYYYVASATTGFCGWGCNGVFTSDSNWDCIATVQGTYPPGGSGYVYLQRTGCSSNFCSASYNGAYTNAWTSAWCAVTCC